MNNNDLSKLLNNFNHFQNENPFNQSNQLINIPENQVSKLIFKIISFI